MSWKKKKKGNTKPRQSVQLMAEGPELPAPLPTIIKRAKVSEGAICLVLRTQGMLAPQGLLIQNCLAECDSNCFLFPSLLPLYTPCFISSPLTPTPAYPMLYTIDSKLIICFIPGFPPTTFILRYSFQSGRCRTPLCFLRQGFL